MLELFRIFGRVDLEGVQEANKDLDGMDNKSKGLGSKLGGFAKTVGKSAAVIGGAIAGVGTAAFAMTNKVTSGFDDIAKKSTKLGVSTDAFQEMSYWASQNGMSASTMERAVGRLNQRIGRAADGNEKYEKALKGLGISMDEVREGTLSTEEAMLQSIQALSQMDTEQQKSAAASELFGTKLARDLMPALQDGSMSMDEARKAAEELGIVIGEDTINAGVKFQDNLTDLKASMGAVGQNIMAELIPVFNNMMDWVLDNMPTIQAVFQTVFDVVNNVFSVAIEWIQSLIAWLSDWRENNEETVNGIWQTIQEVFGNILDFLSQTWETIKSLWEEYGEQLLNNAIFIFTEVWETVKTNLNAVRDVIEQVLEYVVPWVQEKLAVLQDFWEENGEKIMQAVENAFNFIRGVIEFVMPIIEGIIEGAWAIIQAIFDTAIGVIMGLVDWFASLLTGDFEGMHDALIGIWETLWDGIKGIVEGAWTLLSGAFSGLWESIQTWFTGLGDDAWQWGKDLIRGFWEGIKGMGSWLAGKVTSFISDNVPGPIKSVLGIASPSKLAEEYGEDTGEGFGIGLENKRQRVYNASESMANAAASPVENTTTTQVTNDMSNVESLLLRLIEAVKENKDIFIDGDKVTGSVNQVNAISNELRYF